METLPGELIAHVCSFLQTSSIKTFRLCCKSFASIGEVFLFHDFEFRLFPSSHRLYHLEQLASHPTIAAKLTCLSFESGIALEYADYRYWQAQLYHELSSHWSRNLRAKGWSSDAYEDFHADLQGRFTPDMPNRYQLYRWHMDQEAAQMAQPRVRHLLIRAMNTLHQYNPSFQFKVVMSEPRISLEDLEAFDVSQYASEAPEDPDPRRRVTNRRQNCLDHFVNFLHAAQLSNCDIVDLVAVDMPHQLLTNNRLDGSTVLDETFRCLRSVEVKLNSFPHSDWLSRGGLNERYVGGRNLAARRLPALLNISSNLEYLKLELPEGKEAEYSFDLFDRTNIDRFPRHWLPHLKGLELSKFHCTWQDLQALLKAARNLKSLAMSWCRLETGSMIDLIQFVPTMHLEKLSMSGEWVVNEDGGDWHSHTIDDFTSCPAATSYEGPYLHSGLRSQVEHFMLVGGECPLPKWGKTDREDEIWELRGDTSWHYLPGPRRH